MTFKVNLSGGAGFALSGCLSSSLMILLVLKHEDMIQRQGETRNRDSVLMSIVNQEYMIQRGGQPSELNEYKPNRLMSPASYVIRLGVNVFLQRKVSFAILSRH
jgi:hypothetical protein